MELGGNRGNVENQSDSLNYVHMRDSKIPKKIGFYEDQRQLSTNEILKTIIIKKRPAHVM
jgi:hypothetical protein